MISTNKSQYTGYILAILMLITLTNSAFFFLIKANFGMIEWLVYNACSFSIITYLACFTLFQITKKRFFLAISLVPLYYYGTMGLFLTPWNETMFFAHITHIIITMNVLWVLYKIFKPSDFESLGKGLIIGVFVFVPVFAIIQHISQARMPEFIQLLQQVQ